MSRSKRTSVARETIAICEAGHYATPEGRVVQLEKSIGHAVAGTVIYSPEKRSPTQRFNRNQRGYLSVTAETTISGLYRLRAETGGHLACLNFASAKNPGGGFLGGAEAQEETLARSSALYPCLLSAREYYENNRVCGTSLYLDQIIWSPAVPFIRDDRGDLLATPVLASVITAPAPNAGAIFNNETSKAEEIEPTLKRRATIVLAIAAEQNVQQLVLGAWGCGVFRNDPKIVATAFADLLRGEYANVFDQVVFAIYDKSPDQAIVRTFTEALG